MKSFNYSALTAAYKCNTPGCINTVICKGLCEKHYKNQWYKSIQKPKLTKFDIKASNYKAGRSPKGRFSRAKSSAKSLDREWSLTFTEWLTLIQDNECHYCYGTLNETGAGLDRLDNTIGYRLTNVVPCCKNCNIIKGTSVNHDEMVRIAALLNMLRRGVSYA